jgi:hypothetical protein
MRTLWFVEFRAKRGRAQEPDSWVLYDFFGYKSRPDAMKVSKKFSNRNWVYRAVPYDRRSVNVADIANAGIKAGDRLLRKLEKGCAR